MLNKLAPIALALALAVSVPAHATSPQEIDPLLHAYLAAEVNGAYSDGETLIYFAHLDRLVLVIGGTAFEAVGRSVDMSKGRVEFLMTVNGQKEQATFERFGTMAIMTMGDGTAIRMRYVRPLSDMDAQAIVASGAFGEQSLAASPEPAQLPDSPKPAAQQARPSFDCSKAATAVEGMICGNAELAELDSRLATAYKTARDGMDDPGAMRAEQVQWIKQERNACKSIDCLFSVYGERVDDLEQVARYLSKPAEFR